MAHTPKDKQSSLRQFQENLTKRIEEVSEAPQNTLLAFFAGSTHWLIDLADAGEIMPVPELYSVPLAAHWFRGLANVRGTLFGVTDLAAFEGAQITPVENASRLLLIGAQKGSNCAILVSSILGMKNTQDLKSQQMFSDPNRPWIMNKYTDSENKDWYLLNAAKFLASPEFLNAGAEFSISSNAQNTTSI